MTLAISAKDEARFWAKVDKTEGCWEWTAGRNPHGYGHFRLGSKMLGSHRFAYEMANGPIPDGLMVDHACHNRACVNPGHLRAATNKQNGENRGGPQKNNLSSGIRGVCWRKDIKKWQAQVRHNGKRHSAGFFTDIADAEAAVIALRNNLYTHNIADRSAA